MEKLAKIQKELKAPKDLYNSFGGYKYRSAESILEAVKPMLDGAILTLDDDIIAIGPTDKEPRYYVKSTATFQDGGFVKTTTAFAREPSTKKGMDDSQVTGTASSYARKYALNGLFCIDDAKDADTDEYCNQTKDTPQDNKPSVDDIVAGMSKMTLDNWRAFYKRAIELYPKDTPEFKNWSQAFNERKNLLESQKTQDFLEKESSFINAE